MPLNLTREPLCPTSRAEVHLCVCGAQETLHDEMESRTSRISSWFFRATYRIELRNHYYVITDRGFVDSEI